MSTYKTTPLKKDPIALAVILFTLAFIGITYLQNQAVEAYNAPQISAISETINQ